MIDARRWTHFRQVSEWNMSCYDTREADWVVSQDDAPLPVDTPKEGTSTVFSSRSQPARVSRWDVLTDLFILLSLLVIFWRLVGYVL